MKKQSIGKPIFRFGAASFQFIFVYKVPNLAALLVLFPAERQKRLLISLYSVSQIVMVMVLC